MKNIIRFGIVGAGSIAQKFARDIKFVDGAVAAAVASRNIHRANEFKDTHGIEFAFGSYEEMSKSDKIDAVYIVTPDNFHMEQSILFMNHKKHVLCEKPIAVNVIQFEKMVKSAKENKVLLMEAMWTRFLPITLKIREVIQSKQLGKLNHAYLEFGIAAMGLGRDNGRLFNSNLAGGSLLDLGVYPVAYILNITDQPIKSIAAEAQLYKTGIDTECIVDVVFEDNSSATLVSSFLEERNKPGVLEFENGSIIIDNFWRSQKVTINGEVFDFPHIGEGFPHEIEAFANTLKQGLLENNIMTHDQTRKSIEILDRIRDKIGLVYPFE
ncbi:MAG: Gfo/Idh/MocA family oxidoreductase [Tenericutes bacterium]|nr:Gfo/Idh/MocA family oxidoreductase [Mycoplasmatota bacterium]